MLDLILVGLITVITIFLYNIWTPRLKGMPGPSSLPIIGNSIQLLFNLHRRNYWMIESVSKYGDVFQITLPAQVPFVLISTPKNIEHVLKTNFDNYPKGRPFTDRLVDLLGRGIFNVDGDGWKVQRKTASHIFTMKALRDTMTPIFVTHATKLVNYLVKQSPQAQVDIQDCFFRFTLDSISLIAFGVDLHCLDMGSVEFASAFDTAQRIGDKRFFSPAWYIKKFLGVGDEGKMTKALKKINAFAEHVITEHKKLSKSELQSNTDLLSNFLAMEKDDEGNLFTDEYLRDIILNFIIAGRDTTAQALTWTVYELCLNESVLTKLRSEIDTVLGQTPPNYENVQNLPYTFAVISEALRLHPSVPVELKHAVNDDTLPDGTFIPAGTAIVPLVQASMRREDVWGSNASSFDPERWLGSRKYTEFEYPVFQAGPRTCLGKHMAILEAKIMLILLLQKVEFTLVPNQNIVEEVALTLPARFGLIINVRERVKI